MLSDAQRLELCSTRIASKKCEYCATKTSKVHLDEHILVLALVLELELEPDLAPDSSLQDHGNAVLHLASCPTLLCMPTTISSLLPCCLLTRLLLTVHHQQINATTSCPLCCLCATNIPRARVPDRRDAPIVWSFDCHNSGDKWFFAISELSTGRQKQASAILSCSCDYNRSSGWLIVDVDSALSIVCSCGTVSWCLSVIAKFSSSLSVIDYLTLTSVKLRQSITHSLI